MIWPVPTWDGQSSACILLNPKYLLGIHNNLALHQRITPMVECHILCSFLAILVADKTTKA